MLILFVSVGISGLQASSAPGVRYMRQKENPGNSPLCCSLSPEIPSPSTFFSLPFSLLIFALYNGQCF